jgi:hypothetical protein
LTKYLAGQPLQLMMRDRRSGDYLYCLHMWHERLLRRAEAAAAADARRGANG